jgi:predicted Rossmann fold flavoprotein
MPEQVDIVIVGAGAAGLMAAVWLGRKLEGSGQRILLLDGAKQVGVKILVAGGGRCNVTHHEVDERQYAGGSRNTIRKVLQRFDVPQTVQFFHELGVELKREETGKLFPVTDSARTVLDALLMELTRLGVELINPWRVKSIDRVEHGFVIHSDHHDGLINTSRVVLATGGMALPKSGSDGAGYGLARNLGHSITDRVFPSLVPLVIGGASHWLTGLSGISTRASVEVRSGSNKRIVRFENDLLCTHFGLSGPAVMDASRWLTEARSADSHAGLRVGWLPDETFDSVDEALRTLGARTVISWIRERLPERLAKAICEAHGVGGSQSGAQMSKDARRTLAHALVEMPVEVLGDRGFTHAEVTAGGVPLSEIDPKTMHSRVCNNLWLVGEILDVDGRIGGFNFQWAWASGYIAGNAIAASMQTACE